MATNPVKPSTHLSPKSGGGSFKSFHRFWVACLLIFATLYFVVFIAAFQKNAPARYVASFMAGLFGFTAVELLRRSLN